ncbi:hypothetical protein SDC9_207524 [bioreactor metagenome]|uniref:Uncharacterized protein n=1 Tax=bioreactor metagenome TaxID=1076179 RepID=A0A645J9M3_9ZZZZ
MVAHLEWSENLGSGTDHDVVSDGRMPLSRIFSRPSQGDRLIDGHIVSDFCGFSDDDRHAVIDKAPPPDGSAGMDLNACEKSCQLRNQPCDKLQVMQVQPMGRLM